MDKFIKDATSGMSLVISRTRSMYCKNKSQSKYLQFSSNQLEEPVNMTNDVKEFEPGHYFLFI